MSVNGEEVTKDMKKVDNKLDLIFIVIDWMIYIGLFLFAGIFMKDVIGQYQAKVTFMGQTLEPITEVPTIVLCANSPWSWILSSRLVGVSYGAFSE